MRTRAAVLAIVLTAVLPSASPLSAGPPVGAPDCPVFPADSVWHADVSRLPVRPRKPADHDHIAVTRRVVITVG